jgi:hypothetical protein
MFVPCRQFQCREDNQGPNEIAVAIYTLLGARQMLSLGCSSNSINTQLFVPESSQRLPAPRVSTQTTPRGVRAVRQGAGVTSDLVTNGN